jgi:hypothetical protein
MTTPRTLEGVDGRIRAMGQEVEVLAPGVYRHRTRWDYMPLGSGGLPSGDWHDGLPAGTTREDWK